MIRHPKPLYNDPIDLRSGRGSCKGCGECCSRMLPLTPLDIERLRRYISNHSELRLHEHVLFGQPVLDMTCPFLNDEGECDVYDARPDICRAYRCDLHKAGTLEPPKSIGLMKIYDMRAMVRVKEDCDD